MTVDDIMYYSTNAATIRQLSEGLSKEMNVRKGQRKVRIDEGTK
jgi:hypothetical protein